MLELAYIITDGAVGTLIDVLVLVLVVVILVWAIRQFLGK